MKILLYIGHHKVGSTSLQAFFSQNWLALAQAGILYPCVDAEGFADHLQRGLAGQDSTGLPPVNVREPHNALAFRMLTSTNKKSMPPYHRNLPSLPQMLKTLRQQVSRMAPQTVVICSEVMANFGLQEPKLIDRLKGLFPKAEFEIYCALRRPDQYLASWHGQRLKFGHKVKALNDGGALAYRNGIHFDYAAMLAPWIARFPEARIHVRNYADVLTSGGSVEDFTQRVGLALPSGLQQPDRTNPSLPYAAYEIMRRGNQELARPDQLELRKYLLAAAQTLRPNQEVELFGTELRQELTEAFAPVHQYLSQFTKDDAFFPDLDKMRQPHPLPEAEALQQSLTTLHATPPQSAALRAFLRSFGPAPAPQPLWRRALSWR